MQCCGGVEIKNLSDSLNSEEAFKQFMEMMTGEGPIDRVRNPISIKIRSFVVFTGVVSKSGLGVMNFGHPHMLRKGTDYGIDFKSFIEQHELGPVVESVPGMNWTGNEIVAYVWVPNWKKAVALFETLKGVTDVQSTASVT